jgi:hypothetical protein
MGKGKYKNTLEELRETRNFAKLATVYRHLAEFRDSIAAVAPNVPNQILDPTLTHLDSTLKDYRDLASEITGYPVQDGDLRINLGDEFGSAATPGTSHVAGIDTSKIEVIRGLAAAQPFDEKTLRDSELASAVVVRGPEGPELGRDAAAGLVRVVSKSEMRSSEAVRVYDAVLGDVASSPMAAEARGCFNRWLIGAVGFGVAAVIVAVVAWIAFSGDDNDDAEEVVTGETPAAVEGGGGEGEGTGIFAEFSDETQADLAFFDPGVPAELLTISYVVEDETDDAFNSFDPPEVLFEDDYTELRAGYGGRLNMSASMAVSFTCGAETSTGMSVVCAEGVTGELLPGDYVVMIGSVERPLDSLRAQVEYKYSAFVEDRGRTLAFPEGDPRPEFPYNTLIRTNSYFSLESIGGADWALTTRWSEGQQFLPWGEAPATDNTLDYVRGVLGGNTFMLVAPSELFSSTTYYNVGTEAHPAGEEYTAENTTQDVLGANPQEMKTVLYDLLGMPLSDAGTMQEIEQIRERVEDYVAWVREGNGAGISSHLDRSAVLRWGDETCSDYFNRIGPDATFGLEIIDARGPETWDWEIYGIKVGTLFDAYEFDLNLTQQGATQQITAHFAWDDEAEDIRVFSPCVSAEEAAAELAEASAPPGGGGAPGGTDPATGDEVDRILALLPGYELTRRNGDNSLFDYLHPVVVGFYGENVCRDFYANQIGPDPTFAFVNIGAGTGPASYTYMPQGVTVGTADGVYSFPIDTTIGGQTSQFTWRFTLVDGALKTFQRCER